MPKKESSKPSSGELELREKFENEVVRQRYLSAMELVLARLSLINADLTEKNKRPIVRALSSRLKTTDSMIKKLIRKEREVSFASAVKSLNDIAGVRVVCYFCDDVEQIADALRKQEDITIVKEKNYIKKPKKSGYQSLHLIVEIPLVYLNHKDTVRVEIQIRSFAMDYWAELDTQMCYKKSAGRIEQVEREIRNYSAVIAKVDNQMLELRKRIEKM